MQDNKKNLVSTITSGRLHEYEWLHPGAGSNDNYRICKKIDSIQLRLHHHRCDKVWSVTFRAERRMFLCCHKFDTVPVCYSFSKWNNLYVNFNVPYKKAQLKDITIYCWEDDAEQCKPYTLEKYRQFYSASHRESRYCILCLKWEAQWDRHTPSARWLSTEKLIDNVNLQ